LNYAPRSWGNTYKSKLTKISTKQNRCIWCIFFVDSRENANLHYNILGVLKLENIIKLKTEIFASKFSVHDPNVPVAFSDFLNPVHLVYKGPVIISKMGGRGAGKIIYLVSALSVAVSLIAARKFVVHP
jgi:hypothetical protein